MVTDSSLIIFDEENLINAITCALLMSYIDGEVHEKEWTIIQRFVDTHWKENYRDFKKVLPDIEAQIKPYLIQSVAFQGILSELIDNLTKDMTPAQKNYLLNMVGNVMAADGFMAPEEAKLFEMFEEKLRFNYSKR